MAWMLSHDIWQRYRFLLVFNFYFHCFYWMCLKVDVQTTKNTDPWTWRRVHFAIQRKKKTQSFHFNSYFVCMQYLVECSLLQHGTCGAAKRSVIWHVLLLFDKMLKNIWCVWTTGKTLILNPRHNQAIYHIMWPAFQCPVDISQCSVLSAILSQLFAPRDHL